jgi:hypothetical protein
MRPLGHLRIWGPEMAGNFGAVGGAARGLRFFWVCCAERGLGWEGMGQEGVRGFPGCPRFLGAAPVRAPLGFGCRSTAPGGLRAVPPEGWGGWAGPPATCSGALPQKARGLGLRLPSCLVAWAGPSPVVERFRLGAGLGVLRTVSARAGAAHAVVLTLPTLDVVAKTGHNGDHGAADLAVRAVDAYAVADAHVAERCDVGGLTADG